MSDKYFCDTNVCLYALHADAPEKASKAMSVLSTVPMISTQVLGETARTMLKKYLYSSEETERHLRFLSGRCTVATVETDDYFEALRLFREYRFSWWDSLIVATALRAGCATLVSEDMQHGFVVGGRLTIVNPFV
jgi:predicted nucleic acid-binding protein